MKSRVCFQSGVSIKRVTEVSGEARRRRCSLALLQGGVTKSRRFCGLFYRYSTLKTHPSVQTVIRLLRDADNFEYIGEPISQLEHALQCADMAHHTNADDETVIAALLHDIGHWCEPGAELIPGLGVMDHAHVGAAYLLRLGFSERIADLIEGHVQAKRYLVATRPDYKAQLSQASVRTLELQGGPMTSSEVELFQCDPLMNTKLCLRVWDERAKVVGQVTGSLGFYETILTRHFEWRALLSGDSTAVKIER